MDSEHGPPRAIFDAGSPIYALPIFLAGETGVSTKPNVLVVCDVGEDEVLVGSHLFNFCRELCQDLTRQPSVTLHSPDPVDVEQAVRLTRQGESGLIYVVAAARSELAATIAMLDPLGIESPPIEVVFDEGRANFELRNVGRSHIVELVLTALRMADFDNGDGNGNDGEQAGEVVDFPTQARRPAPLDRANDPPPGSPAPVAFESSGPTDKVIRQSLHTALDWADAATGVLVDLWSDRVGHENAIYGQTWERLLASLERLVGIRDVPMDKAEEQYRLVRAMLRHSSAQATPLVRLGRLLDFDDLALKLIMLALAPELDIRFQRLFGALHDDMGRRHVSLGLACAIVAAATEKATPRRIRSELSRLEAVRDFRLLVGFGDTLPAADAALRIDPRLLDWLVTGETRWLTADAEFGAIRRGSPQDALPLLPAGRRELVEQAVAAAESHAGPTGRSRVTMLTGSEPGWIEVEAMALAGQELRIGPPAAAMPPEVLDRILREAVRAARLLGQRLVIDLIEPGPQGESFWRMLAPILSLCQPAPLVLSDNPAWLLAVSDEERATVVPLHPVAQRHRVDAIAAALGSGGGAASDLAAELGESYRIPLVNLPDVAPLAQAEARSRRIDRPGEAEWHAAFRNVAGSRVPQLARRVAPRPKPAGGSQLDRVVLPKAQRVQLETLISHVRVGGTVLRDWHFADVLDARGVSALFTGESGTGKTTAAHAVASELGTDLYVVDLARMVSKYIGETEKNLDIIFTEAERAGAVLLFDEADALFGKRSAVNDAHDRYANIEVAYLLQRVECFDGLAILTTNHPGNIDKAFARRLRFTVEFPFPMPQDRLLIWERALPKDSPYRAADVDFVLAARRLEVNGGSIRQMLLHALMAAASGGGGAVTSQHLQDAARTELIRLGRHDKLSGIDGLFRPQAEAA